MGVAFEPSRVTFTTFTHDEVCEADWVEEAGAYTDCDCRRRKVPAPYLTDAELRRRPSYEGGSK